MAIKLKDRWSHKFEIETNLCSLDLGGAGGSSNTTTSNTVTKPPGFLTEYRVGGTGKKMLDADGNVMRDEDGNVRWERPNKKFVNYMLEQGIKDANRDPFTKRREYAGNNERLRDAYRFSREAAQDTAGFNRGLGFSRDVYGGRFQNQAMGYANQTNPYFGNNVNGYNNEYMGQTTNFGKNQYIDNIGGREIGYNNAQNDYLANIKSGNVGAYQGQNEFLNAHGADKVRSRVTANNGINQIGKNTNNVSVDENKYQQSKYLDKVIKKTQDDVTKQYNKTVRPEIQAAQRMSGAFGNSGIKEMKADKQGELADSLADISNKYRFDDYQAKRNLEEANLNRQLQADTFNSGQGYDASLNRARLGLDQGKFNASQRFNADTTNAANQLNWMNTRANLGNTLASNYANQLQSADQSNAANQLSGSISQAQLNNALSLGNAGNNLSAQTSNASNDLTGSVAQGNQYGNWLNQAAGYNAADLNRNANLYANQAQFNAGLDELNLMRNSDMWQNRHDNMRDQFNNIQNMRYSMIPQTIDQNNQGWQDANNMMKFGLQKQMGEQGRYDNQYQNALNIYNNESMGVDRLLNLYRTGLGGGGSTSTTTNAGGGSNNMLNMLGLGLGAYGLFK